MGDNNISDAEKEQIRLTLSGLETPACLIDLTELERRIRAMAVRFQQAGKKWRPAADSHLLPEVSNLQCRIGAHGAALTRGPFAPYWQNETIPSLLIAQPPLTPAQIRRTFSREWSAQPAICCDHYVQAERLSQFACQQEIEIPLLIELNLGQSRAGVRLGLDSRELIRGIASLPRVRIIGLSADLGIFAAGDPQNEKQMQSASEMLKKLQRDLIRNGGSCEVVSVAGEGELDSVLESEVITEIRTGRSFDDSCHSLQGERDKPCCQVLASVFNRSTLERGVLDVGHSLLAEGNKTVRVDSTASFRPLPDTTILEFSPESLSLELGPASRDLVIGSKVLVTPGDPSTTLLRFDPIYGIRNGEVESVWTRPRLSRAEFK